MISRLFGKEESAVPTLLILFGIGAIALAYAYDFAGIGSEGFGTVQARLILLGVAMALSGIALITPLGQRLLSRLIARVGISENPLERVANLLIVSAWFGLASGLVEGIGYLIAQRYLHSFQVWTQIIWISALFNLILFSLIGLALSGAALVLRRLPFLPLALFLLTFLTFWDWAIVGLNTWITGYALLILAAGASAAFVRWQLSRQASFMRFWRRSLPWVAGIAILAFVGIEGGGWLQERIATARLSPAPQNAPNILVILVDTLRADHLSSYGYERQTSPNIDRMAEQGVLFENAFSTSSWTAPSHASLLTGTFPHEHRVFWAVGNSPNLDDGYLTLAEVLRDRGYRTAAFSANTDWFTRVEGFGQGFIRYEDYFHSPLDMALRTTYGRKLGDYLRIPTILDDPKRKWAPDISGPYLKWVNNDHDKPFFAFLNYFDVHDPYVPPQPYRSRFSDKANPGGHINSDILDGYDPRLTQERLQDEIDAYDGAISYIDYEINKLFNELERMGLDKNLLVVFTSDHGEAFGEHGTVQHANSVYREEIFVPLVIRWPGQVPSGIRAARPVSNASVPATILDLLGEGSSNPFPGPSLKELWENPATHPDWPFPLAEMEYRSWKPIQAPARHGAMRSLVGPENHYIQHDTLGVELYNWQEDPREQSDLAETAEGQTIIGWFETSMERVFTRRP